MASDSGEENEIYGFFNEDVEGETSSDNDGVPDLNFEADPGDFAAAININADMGQAQTDEGGMETAPLIPQSPQHNQNHHKPRLSNEVRLQLLHYLLDKKIAGFLPHGSIKDAAQHFGYSTRTISKLWNKARRQRESMHKYDLDNLYHNCGRKRIEVPYDNIAKIGMGDRSCIQDLAAMLELAPTTVWRMIKRGIINPHTNSLHPGITEDNKMARIDWIIRLIQQETIDTTPTYYSMYDFVHIDEKWFYLTQKSQRVYLAKGEPKPYRAGKSRKFIPKVMFMGCVARPRWNENGHCKFDGKIGIFPFTKQVPAKRSSKNRKKGTFETKPVESVNQNVTRDMLIHQIIPAIKAKWPVSGSNVIYIQQDNAKAHILQDDPEWQKHFQQDGFTFILTQQPPNSQM